LSMNVDGSHYATRAYATGTGEGAGIAMRMEDNKSLLRDGHPLLENSTSYPSVSETSTLAAYAITGTNIHPMVELHATCDIAAVRCSAGRWIVGLESRIKPGPWTTISNLEKPLRIIRAADDFDSTHSALYFPEEPAWRSASSSVAPANRRSSTSRRLST